MWPSTRLCWGLTYRWAHHRGSVTYSGSGCFYYMTLRLRRLCTSPTPGGSAVWNREMLKYKIRGQKKSRLKAYALRIIFNTETTILLGSITCTPGTSAPPVLKLHHSNNVCSRQPSILCSILIESLTGHHQRTPLSRTLSPSPYTLLECRRKTLTYHHNVLSHNFSVKMRLHRMTYLLSRPCLGREHPIGRLHAATHLINQRQPQGTLSLPSNQPKEATTQLHHFSANQSPL